MYFYTCTSITINFNYYDNVIDNQGCREEHKGDGFQRNQPDWVAMINSNYSYTRMTLHNHTHVTLQQISIDLVITLI